MRTPIRHEAAGRLRIFFDESHHAMGRKKHEEITGEFDFERFVFQDAEPEQRTIIGELVNHTTIKGKAKKNELQYGMTYRFYGYWTNHPRYGKQFAFETFTPAQPAGERGTVQYLARARGIGRKRAQQIWNMFGPDSLKMVREDPVGVVEAIPGLTLAQAREAAERFKADEALEAVTIEVTDLLGSRGFPKRIIKQVIETWGNRAVEVIKENPYVLILFKGVGFLKADQLYLELGHDPAAITRQAWCARHAIESDTCGSTWFPLEKCRDAIHKNVAGTKVDVDGALKYAVENGLLEETQTENQRWFAEAGKAVNEADLADSIHQAELESETGLMQWPAVEDCVGLSEHQRGELAKAMQGYIGVLAGSPGTGKTYTLASIIKTLGTGSVAVCAPTGKAAVRVTESLAAQGVSLTARTIHSTLGVVSADGGWTFAHDDENPLPFRYIFVDESSMIDTDLMRSLLAARGQGAHVLFVGDPDQLSPVGHGAPLRDMIAMGLPCGHLKEIQRNAGRIVRACAEIRDKHRFATSKKIALSGEQPENLLLIERAQPAGQLNELKQLLGRMQSGGKRDAVWDAQVVVAVNEKSPLARKALNKELQSLLNPHGEQCEPNPFRVGDKIICTANGLLPAEDSRQEAAGEDGQIYVANGELARVEKVAEKYTVAKLTAPERVVRIPRGQAKEGNETGCSWELGYAISVHKSQGSEWPILVVILDSYPGAVMLCDRHWIYTAISRAKELGILIGKKSVAENMCRKSHVWKRKTFLREGVEELREASLDGLWEQDLEGVVV